MWAKAKEKPPKGLFHGCLSPNSIFQPSGHNICGTAVSFHFFSPLPSFVPQKRLPLLPSASTFAPLRCSFPASSHHQLLFANSHSQFNLHRMFLYYGLEQTVSSLLNEVNYKFINVFRYGRRLGVEIMAFGLVGLVSSQRHDDAESAGLACFRRARLFSSSWLPVNFWTMIAANPFQFKSRRLYQVKDHRLQESRVGARKLISHSRLVKERVRPFFILLNRRRVE